MADDWDRKRVDLTALNLVDQWGNMMESMMGEWKVVYLDGRMVGWWEQC